LLVSSVVERAPPPAAFDFDLDLDLDLDFDFDFVFDLDSAEHLNRSNTPAPAPILLPQFSHCSDDPGCFSCRTETRPPPSIFSGWCPETRTAQTEGLRRCFLTLYIQNIKPGGVFVSSPLNLYFPANQSFKQKSSCLGP
jgi:hypothetical protein